MTWKKSLRATKKGILLAKTALTDKGLYQKDLVGDVCDARSTISRFFTGKPVSNEIFTKICSRLSLDWKNVAEIPSFEEKGHLDDASAESVEKVQLIEEVRDKVRTDIDERCGTMRVLDMRYPIGLKDIYTEVNILEKVIGSRHLSIDRRNQLLNVEHDEVDRYGLGRVEEKRVPGIEAVSDCARLLVLGKPGSGKTTFLKYLAIQCISEQFQALRIPVFVTLKDFAEHPGKISLFDYIVEFFLANKVPITVVDELLTNGRLLVLLDGLDEVREEDSKRVIGSIEEFTRRYAWSKEFKDRLEPILKDRQRISKKIKEIKDSRKKKEESAKQVEEKLNKEHVKLYELNEKDRRLKTQDTEAAKSQNSDVYQVIKELRDEGDAIARDIKRLKTNIFSLEKQEKELSAITSDYSLAYALFSKEHPGRTYRNHFVITCRIAAKEFNFEKFTEVEVADFEDKQIESFVYNWFTQGRFDKDEERFHKFIRKLNQNKRVKDLATNPLLLTLLCLVFQDSGSFSANRSDLYRDGISILLKKWDATRKIERAQPYKNLSINRKEDLLANVALKTFKDKKYFFKQIEVERLIVEFIQNLSDIRRDEESLRLDSEAILKSIESQHGLLIERARGVYSFSHLTFHEYFTAQKIVKSPSSKLLESELKSLAKNITIRRWREVFLITIELLTEADEFLKLVRAEIDIIAIQDQELSGVLECIDTVANRFSGTHKKSAIRAILISIIYELSMPPSGSFSSNRTELEPDIYFATTLDNSVSKLFIDKVLQSSYVLKDLSFSNPRRKRSELELFKEFKLIDVEVLRMFFDPYSFETICEAINRCNSYCSEDEKRDLRKTVSSIVKKTEFFGKSWKGAGLRESIRTYLAASRFLLECLSCDCYVSVNLRQSIKEDLLLPLYARSDSTILVS